MNALSPNVQAESFSDTVEDYLRTILMVRGHGLVPTLRRLSDFIGVSLPTVTNTLKRMEREGLVYRDQRNRVCLSPLGQTAAGAVTRRHHLMERFLYEVLHVALCEVAAEADRLEHTVTPRIERQLYLVLGRPETCPHGNPLETGVAASPHDAALGAFRFGRVEVTRVLEIATSDVPFVRWLEQRGIVPGSCFEVLSCREGQTVLSNGLKEVRLPVVAGQMVMARYEGDAPTAKVQPLRPEGGKA